MPVLATSTHATLANFPKHEYIKTSAVTTAQGANGAYNTFVYQHKPTKATIDTFVLQMLKFITVSTLEMSYALDDVHFHEDFTSEMYRQTRILYDNVVEARRNIVIQPLSAAMKRQLPKPLLDLFDATWRMKFSMDKFVENAEAYFETLDEPAESYESPYFKRMSEQEVWSSRCKAYQYRI